MENFLLLDYLPRNCRQNCPQFYLSQQHVFNFQLFAKSKTYLTAPSPLYVYDQKTNKAREVMYYLSTFVRDCIYSHVVQHPTPPLWSAVLILSILFISRLTKLPPCQDYRILLQLCLLKGLLKFLGLIKNFLVESSRYNLAPGTISGVWRGSDRLMTPGSIVIKQSVRHARTCGSLIQVNHIRQVPAFDALN